MFAMRLPIVPGALAVLAVSAFGSAANAVVIDGNRVVITYGNPPEPHARISFNKERGGRQGVSIDTFGAGGAGSILSVLVDGAMIFEHVFIASDCGQGDSAGACRVAINDRDQMTGRLRDSFRRGKISRVQIVTAGTMAMQIEAKLQNFSRAMRGR